ncbi:unnamed protein product [Zymoseptoria tritici ST99CH_1A5]|uniref:Uncharacterized protein n=3 Tax=Zymoseptoria tritici TaxID=1047171 RepID=A0A1X7RTF2_ZYMT9|nr:unnamed protein product [Zymoseptoria tritici ST99CH_3D7]SMR52552.1 unnamed protein product [Zymoseptoria tritici ST99CH_1E4]SMY24343.1 unnamed protein product [Zymoseptoria tritici ST99CH_1A5]
MKLLAHLLLMATAISGAIADDYGRCDGPPDQEQKAVCGDVAGKLITGMDGNKKTFYLCCVPAGQLTTYYKYCGIHGGPSTGESKGDCGPKVV